MIGSKGARTVPVNSLKVIGIYVVAANLVTLFATGQALSARVQGLRSVIPDSISAKVGEVKPWGWIPTPSKEPPDWSKEPPETMGGIHEILFTRAQKATVIVRSRLGYGSGVLVSPDGWLLTNYHVIASNAQHASTRGELARLDILTCTLQKRRIIRRQGTLPATVYHVEPHHDLALLKLDRLPSDVNELPHFDFARSTEFGEDCYVVGSPPGGMAWKISIGNLGSSFKYPEGISDAVVWGPASEDAGWLERRRLSIFVTDCAVSLGHMGGPLFNETGELMGVTFTGPPARASDSAYHIAVEHLVKITKELPTAPEGVPFDPWTAGAPGSVLRLGPEIVDLNKNGRIDAIVIPFADVEKARYAARVVFVDLRERTTIGSTKIKPSMKFPRGLWGMEIRGNFSWDFMFTYRHFDNLLAYGYPDAANTLAEIHIDHNGDDRTDVAWRRSRNGSWIVDHSLARLPAYDASRFTLEQEKRLRMIVETALSQRPRD